MHTDENSHATHLMHVSSRRTLLGVFAALVLLTLITVAVAGAASDAWEIWIALGIASAKTFLVATYFMHLKYDNPFHAILLVAAVGFVALFLGLTLADAQSYFPQVEQYLQQKR